jgi:copper transport protein
VIARKSFVAAVGIVGFLVPLIARAHPHLMRSRPAAAETVMQPPRILALTFSEKVEAKLSSALITGPNGDTIKLASFHAIGDGGSTVEAQIPGTLAAGNYSVEWACVGVDGHAIHGRFAFAVAVPKATVQETNTEKGAASPSLPPSAVSVEHVAERESGDSGGIAGTLARIGTFTCLMLVIAAVAFRVLILQRANVGDQEPSISRSVVGFGALGAALLLPITAVRLFIATKAIAASSGNQAVSLVQVLTETRWGSFTALTALGAVVALIGFAFALRKRLGWIVAGLGGIISVIGIAFTGHAATLGSFSTLGVAADALHVVAVSCWIGCLFLLIFVAVRSTLEGQRPDRWVKVSQLVRAFSPVAMAAMGVLLVTGTFSGWMQVRSFANLFGTSYGTVLLVKLGLFAATAFTGAYNYRVVTPALGTENGTAKLERSSKIEIGLGIAILIVTGFLTGLATPTN